MKVRKSFLSLLFGLSSIGSPNVFAQTEQADSLKLRITQEVTDTARARLYIELGELLYGISHDSLLHYCQKAGLILENCPNSKVVFQLRGRAYCNVGLSLTFSGKNRDALKYFSMAQQNCILAKDTMGLAMVFVNLGYLFDGMGQYVKALEYYSNALKLQEKAGDSEGMGYSMNNIAHIYELQKLYQDALKLHQRAFQLRRNSGDTLGMAYSLNNIGLAWSNIGRPDSALHCFKASLEMNERLKFHPGIAQSLNNLASIYSKQGKEADAILLYHRALVLDRAGSVYQGEIVVAKNIGELFLILYHKQGNRSSLDSAKYYAEASYRLACEHELLEDMRTGALLLSAIYEEAGDMKQSLSFFKLQSLYQDSISNRESQRMTIRQQERFEFERQMEQAKEDQLRKDFMVEQDIKRSRNILIGVIGIALFLGGFSFFIYRTLRTTRRQRNVIAAQKGEVERQKNLVEEKQKEILDSIHYARRIQRSLLPTDSYINKSINKLRDR
ncbi:MAG: tetratricopeptide repeat protein [Bacteroidia bacterium]|nr:tetratricopeptide repeat protein [Bacteroidia bacterium]